MLWIVLLTTATYIRTLWNTAISDDITVLSEAQRRNYAIRWREHLSQNPLMIIHDLYWKIWKGKWFWHHLVNLITYIILTCSLYFVGQKFFPQDIAFLATLFFIVHPCNCQIAGWISGRWYMVALILGLWAVYLNSPIPYIISSWTAPTMLLVPFLLKIPLWAKIGSLVIYLHFLYWAIGKKDGQVNSEGWFKREHMWLYSRKVIIAIKSFAYYFTLALFPIHQGWFHELGEPIDEKIKSVNLHLLLAVILVGCIICFIGKPAFIGLFIFCLFIAPFVNIITPALFTSERYMAPALVGWSVFLAFTLKNYPIVAAILITAYFLRTQLELWAYQDDFHLALYSLLNFKNSGFAWCNISNYFLHSNRPAAAHDMIRETIKRLPEFPTAYYQMYLMNRASDLLNNLDLALDSLEKACRYGKHNIWYNELEDFRGKLKQVRIGKFRENVTRHTIR